MAGGDKRMSEETTATSAEWKAYWPVILSAMFGMSFYAMVTYSFDQFAAPIEREFGLSRSQVYLGLMIFSLLPVVFGPAVGALIDRFGTRRVAVPGMLLSSAGFAAIGLANGSLLQWCLLWLALGFASLLIKSTVWTVAVTRLFTVGRGFALSVMLCGTALAEATAKLLPNWLVIHYGWRMAYVGVAGLWGGLATLLVLLMFREKPLERSSSQVTSLAAAAELPGLTMREALRSPPLIRIGLTNFLFTIVGGWVAAHLALVLMETGLDRTGAAEVAATAGVAGIAGKLVAGWLCDRVRSPLFPFAAFALGAVGDALLVNPFHSTAMLTLAVMILGFAGGASFQVTAYLCGRYGGLRNFGKIYSVVASLMMFGAAVGPPIAGLLHDIIGSYRPLLLAAAPTVLLAAFLMIGLGPYPEFNSRSDQAPNPDGNPAS
jgi:MFS family permease